MSKFSSESSRALGGPDWLVDWRARAAEQLETLAWPTSADEAWRYSRIDDFDLNDFRPLTEAELGAAGVEAAPGGGILAAEVGARAGLIVVRNGRVVHRELDDALASKGVRVEGLATTNEPKVRAALGTVADASADAFTTLHDAFLAGGAAIYVPAGVVVEQPIVVVHWCEGNQVAVFPHTLVVAEAQSEVTIVERFESGADRVFVDAVVELRADDGANVRYLAVQEFGAATVQVALQRAHLGRDARVRAATVALGGGYARQRCEARLDGAGAESDLMAVYYGDGSQMHDVRTLQDHVAPHTRSTLLFKGAVEESAQSVYSGLIRIREEAQKAEAYQTNRNLVLTEGASAESIPNLEIETNDVRCSHASTVGPIDDDQRYYLESRGVHPEDAERLIVLGFFEDVFAKLPIRALEPALRRAVSEKLGHLEPAS
ncbi:MAG: Fe-S cluster assembly protein SufD [Acidimicrobiia bacterium]